MSPQIAYTEQFQEHLTRTGKSPNTVRAYTQDVAAFAEWFAGTYGEAFDPQAVDPRDVRDYRGFLMRNGLAPATINRRLVALRGFFEWAKQAGHADHSPFDILENVRVKEQQDTAPRWLTRSEELALLRVVRKGKSIRDVTILQTFLGTGLRISELAALKVSDLEISERKGTITVRGGKGGKAREVPLDKRTRRALARYLQERPADAPEALFLGQRGPLSEAGINYLVKKYAYQAQLEDCTAHTLRHTFAKRLVDADTPLDQVATLLGHESLDTTRIYTRPSERDLERAVRRAGGEIVE